MDDFFTFREVSRRFIRRDGMFSEPYVVDAVKTVDLSVRKGETLGLVGESGCGKSTLARMAVRLLPPSAGDVLLEGASLFDGPEDFIAALPRRVQMVFQDPYSSFNPRMRVGTSVGEALACLGRPAKHIQAQVAEMLERVGLEPGHARRYPHEFSGGQRQRLAIARALVTRPDFVVCDEPVSSLDASVQAQVLGLLKDLQDSLGLTYLFISHDLAVVSHMSDRIAVMHQGRVVELATAEQLFTSPLHPYTRTLLAAVPAVESSGLATGLAAGNMASVPFPPAGCPERAPLSQPGSGPEPDSGSSCPVSAPVPDAGSDSGTAFSNMDWDRCLYYASCPCAMDVCAAKAPALAVPLCPEAIPPGEPGNDGRHRVCCHLYSGRA